MRAFVSSWSKTLCAIPRSFESLSFPGKCTRLRALKWETIFRSTVVSALASFFLFQPRHRAKEWFFVHSSKMYESEVEKSCVKAGGGWWELEEPTYIHI